MQEGEKRNYDEIMLPDGTRIVASDRPSPRLSEETIQAIHEADDARTDIYIAAHSKRFG